MKGQICPVFESSAPSGKHSSASSSWLWLRLWLWLSLALPPFPAISSAAFPLVLAPSLTGAMISRTRQPGLETVRPGGLLGPLRLYSRRISVHSFTTYVFRTALRTAAKCSKEPVSLVMPVDLPKTLLGSTRPGSLSLSDASTE
jgi:hypothetical protein